MLDGWVVVRHALDVREGRAAKGIDRLIGIANDAEIAVGADEGAQQSVLNFIRILKLVNNHVGEAGGIACPEGRIGLEAPDERRREVAEIAGRNRVEDILVCAVHLRQFPQAFRSAYTRRNPAKSSGEMR